MQIPDSIRPALRAAVVGLLMLALPMPANARWDTATVLEAARGQVGVTLHYDPGYTRIGYPGGDVPIERGVCTDVVVRALRAAGIDLQRLVHEDMRQHFGAYPANWGLKRPDRNIDHRRVPNLETYFRRRGMETKVSDNPSDYAPGDIVSWTVPPHLPHIGIVSDVVSPDGSGRPLVVHNIGRGTQLEDVLFRFPQRGHFRWELAPANSPARR